MIYIIDGYNVMHAIEEGRGIAAAELDEKRRQFVEAVVSHAAVTGVETVIVFDSAAARSPESHSLPGAMVTVFFASAKESADIIIGKLVQKYLSERRGRIRVVSADWEVQKSAMQERVERIPPRHFISSLKNFEKKVANSGEMDKMRWKIEHKVDVETLKKLEEMRRRMDEED